jgi:outer membrane protein
MGVIQLLRLRTGILVLVAVVFMAAQAFAEPIQLDWVKAWKLALERSEQVASARDEIAKADHQIGEAYSAAMPTVDVTGVMQHYFMLPEMIMILPGALMGSGDSTSGPPPDIRLKTKRGTENTANASIDINQPLYTGGKLGIALELAKIYSEISKLGLKVTWEELRLALVRIFYGALLTEEYMAVSNEAITQAERHYRQAQNLFDQGMVSEYDLIRANVAVANLRPQVLEAETARDMAYKGLLHMIGMDIDSEVELTGNLEITPENLLDYDAAVKAAMSNRDEFTQLGLQAEMYEGQYKIEKHSTLWPNVILNMKYETMAQADDMNISKYEFLGGFGGSLIVQIPLFDGFASKHKAETALINKRSVYRQRELLERGVKIQVFEAQGNYRKATERLKAARETLSQATRGSEIAEVRYKEGVGTQLELLDSELQVNNSKVNVLQAQYDLRVAEATFRRAMGSGVGSD